MGFSSVTEWDLLGEAEEEQAANSLVSICSHFMNSLPALLSGLRILKE
jgi:hypothetical protein